MVTTLIAGALYVVATVLYLAFVMGERERFGAVARVTLAAAAAVHMADIAAHCVRGAHPASSAREAVSFAAFAVVVVFLGFSWRSKRLAAVGGLVAPASLMLLIAARVAPLGVRPQGIGTLGRVHITLAVLGVALFAVAALASALYLAQAKQLKRKSFGTLFHRGPPLEQLDRIVQRCVSLGFPVFTVAIVLGALWMARLGGTIQSMPQYLLALVTWIAFAGLLVSRAVAGWHGRRSALLAILGFASSLAVLALYLLRGAFRA
jgi:ABC-type uncharacterized transport system permease subunit